MNENTIFIVTLFAGLALIILVVSLITRRYSKSLESNRASNLAWLQQYGKRVTAYVMSVQGGEGNSAARMEYAVDNVLGATPRQLGRDMQAASAGINTYHVVAQWTNPETQKSYTFSGTFTRDELPQHYIPGSDVTFEVTVLIDSNNPKRYMMQLPRSR